MRDEEGVRLDGSAEENSNRTLAATISARHLQYRRYCGQVLVRALSSAELQILFFDKFKW
jgi:hypothetical protein